MKIFLEIDLDTTRTINKADVSAQVAKVLANFYRGASVHVSHCENPQETYDRGYEQGLDSMSKYVR